MFEPYVSMACRRLGRDVLTPPAREGRRCIRLFSPPVRHQFPPRCARNDTRYCRPQHWLGSTRELAQVSAEFYPQVAPDILASSLRRYREAGLWSRTVELSREGFARLAESLLSGGFISRMPQYEDCVDESLGDN